MMKILHKSELKKKLIIWPLNLQLDVLEIWDNLSEKQQFELSEILQTANPAKLSTLLKNYETESKNIEAQQKTLEEKFYLNLSIDS